MTAEQSRPEPSGMVERVARALGPIAWAALGVGDSKTFAARRAISLKSARTVIEAMREPTDAMLDAGGRQESGDLDGYATIGKANARGAFRAMIDAALSVTRTNAERTT